MTSDADYFAHPGINHSTLKWFVKRTPAHARYYMTQEPPPRTPDMEFGTAVHSLLLGGPEVVQVKCMNWRQKWANAEREAAREAGGVALLTDDYERACDMVEAVKAHPLARKLVDHADHLEHMVEWHAWIDGERVEPRIECKAKLDGITARFGWDLKTTYDAGTEAFGRSAAKYAYHTQAAWYLEALRHGIGISNPKFLFVVVEKEPPHLVNVIELDEYDVLLGAKRNARALEIYRRCVEADEWPGYGDEINIAQLPRWAEIEEEAA